MALVFHQGLAIPLWAIALCAIALTSPSRPLPSVTVLLAVSVIASMMMVMCRWLGTPRPLLVGPVPSRDTRPAGLIVSVVPEGMCVGMLQRSREMPTQEETDDALDLVRMDDDGGWRVPLEPSLTESRPPTRTPVEQALRECTPSDALAERDGWSPK
jgi:hypothetical protein